MAHRSASPRGITLPPNFSPATPASLSSHVSTCIEFLTSPLVSSLLHCHPNDIAVSGPNPEWGAWWKWGASGPARWKSLVPGWPHDQGSGISNLSLDIPVELKQMLETIEQLSLPRTPDCSVTWPSPEVPIRGMSPQKSHEVSQMSALIGSMCTQNGSDIKHIVDVGAGQGYLSRALSDHPLSMNVLALDFSEVQTKGAERRGDNIKKKRAKAAAKKTAPGALDPDGQSGISGSRLNSVVAPSTTGTLTHEMIHINPQTLNSSVTRWISSMSSSSSVSSSPTPVVLVALHACGTLTPDILRCFLSCCDQMTLPQSRDRRRWYPAGLAVVGCCYNLMSPSSDFPLSITVSEENKKHGRKLVLSYNHRSLAAQCPLQWALNDFSRAAAELAVRKVVYRALFGKLASLSPSTNMTAGGTDDNHERHGKIGRLRDSAYASLDLFIVEANKKMNTDVPFPVDKSRGLEELTRCLGVLHVLRSRIGPVIESLIIVDRWLYLAENLPESDVRAITLFDQNLGSARNVAHVVSPGIDFVCASCDYRKN